MITTVEEYNKQLNYVIEGLRQRVAGETPTVFPSHSDVYRMDKPIKVYTANYSEWVQGLIDKGEYYEMSYPRFGDLRKNYTNNFCWIIDQDTVFFIERPFKNRVIRLLQELLPNHKIHSIKNDVMIDGKKIGPTCMAGAITDWTGEHNPPDSSLIYCLRWSNVDGLDQYFEGDPNHEARKANTEHPLTSLDQYLDMSKEEFEEVLDKYLD